jgi:hypothetical protein
MNECMSGDICADEPVESTIFPGSFRFCKSHQDRLDFVRDELAKKNFKTKVQNYKGAEIERYCETSGCSERPLYGSDYCYDCNGDC